MAKSLYSIQMDFKKANDCAAKLEEASRKLKKTAKECFQNETRKLEACWRGENSVLYINKCYSLTRQMERTASQLMETANTVRIIAKNTYNADIKARNIALMKRATKK